MDSEKAFLLIRADVLPSVYLNVVKAKKLIAQGKVKSSSQAAQMAGISRSVFYKYKDSVFEYDTAAADHIITLSVLLYDEQGILSSVLSEMSGQGANILTINQSIPVDGVAHVSISARIDAMPTSTNVLVEKLAGLYGVVEVKNIMGK